MSINMGKVTVTGSGNSMILPRHPDYRKNSEDWPEPQPKAIGYWASEHQPNLPNPQVFIAEHWKASEKQAVLTHLRTKGEIEHQWMGSSWCRLCATGDADNGSQCFTDGCYVWPEGFAHYIEDHDVKPSREFIEHVLRY